MIPKYAWEPIDNNTDRLKVPGGWLVRTIHSYGGDAVHMVFVSDPEYSWKL